ncbi:von Hippel-Lindau-like protein [Actinia tenebrosa]|uniref:von Hippel-Lindau-like protein n=1 Tax=Actinia tenebrosa TaxID=6105 RepID=A0A6P8IST5_ACTTE|nr:von Hippel-Lindau-like protein [Actinia tenebrosa]
MENNDQDQEEQGMRSLHHHCVSPVRFQNRTGRNVNLIWIDYEGKQGMLVELQKEQDQNLNTYVTHPWLAEDSETKERLLLNFSEVFFPVEPEIVINDFRPRRAQAKRILVKITTPVHRLEKYCKQVILGLVDKENIKHLPLPPIIIKILLES